MCIVCDVVYGMAACMAAASIVAAWQRINVDDRVVFNCRPRLTAEWR